MATLAGQRAQFTWALNQYNLTDDADTRDRFARRMAKYIFMAPTYGFTPEAVTQGRSYPAEAVAKHLADPDLTVVDELPEVIAIAELESAVDSSEVVRFGAGSGVVYAYGYRCAPDRLKVGMTTGDTVQRIAEQIWTSTPDRPVLYVEVKCDRPRSVEKAIQATLEARGLKVTGGGDEWFRTTAEQVVDIAKYVLQSDARVAS